MTTSFTDKLQCTIAVGVANSNAIVTSQIHDSAAIGIIAPAALDVGHTYVIEINENKDASGNWVRLKDRDGNDTLVPPADSAMWYPELPSFPAFRITDITGNAAGTDKIFTIMKLHTA